MPTEVTDLLLDMMNELKADVQSLRKQMHEEHAELSERVGRLEHDGRVTRWMFGAGGALLMFTARELLPKLLT